MPRNGSGVYSLVTTPFATAGAIAVAATVNANINDLGSEITASLPRAGTAAMTGALPMGSNKITGLATGTAATDAPTLAQVQSGIVAQATAVGGTVDGITLTFSPVHTAYTANMRIRWTSGGVNTVTNPTVNADSLGVKTVKKGAGSALTAGDLGASGYICEAVYNGTDFLLLNPATLGSAASETAAGIVELATDAETQTGTDTARAVTPANLTAKEATVAHYRANTSDRILTTDIAWSAAAEVSLTDAATIAVDMSSFINAIVTLGGNRTLGQPSNTKVGQSGVIRIIQDGTGSRTLGYHADWKFAGGTDPVLSTAAGTTDLLFYQVIAANVIYASLAKAIA
jgi:hypothetical protein